MILFADIVAFFSGLPPFAWVIIGILAIALFFSIIKKLFKVAVYVAVVIILAIVILKLLAL